MMTMMTTSSLTGQMDGIGRRRRPHRGPAQRPSHHLSARRCDKIRRDPTTSPVPTTTTSNTTRHHRPHSKSPLVFTPHESRGTGIDEGILKHKTSSLRDTPSSPLHRQRTGAPVRAREMAVRRKRTCCADDEPWHRRRTPLRHMRPGDRPPPARAAAG